MFNILKIIVIEIIILSIVPVTILNAQSSSPHIVSNKDASKLRCSICHYCKNPTIKEPCIYSCPRHRNIHQKDLSTSPDEGPDTVILNELENLYEPTVFKHKLHAENAVMGKGCTECHHYEPQGQYSSCKTCHSVAITCENAKQVGLKGAYHRQCIGCHQDWSKETDCQYCHLSKGTKPSEKHKTALKQYPLVQPPQAKKYKTRFLGNSTVLFNHEDHTKEYGISCKECHFEGGCTPCHAQKDIPQPPSPHQVQCLNCHKSTSCDTCHINGTSSFNHDETNFKLRSFHKNLDCRKCHTDEKRHHSAPMMCTKCHELTWIKKHFIHETVGFSLDANHSALSCNECHQDLHFNRPTDCSNCHDNNYVYPKNIPGHPIASSP